MFKIAIASLIFLCAFAITKTETTDPNIEDFLKTFVKERDCSKISLSGNLFSFKSDKDVDSEIELFQLYIFNEKDPLKDKDVKEISKMIKNYNLELLNMIKSKDSNVEIYIKEKNDIIDDVFMLVSGKEDGILFHAKGKLRYKDLQKLNIDFDGSEELKNYKKQ